MADADQLSWRERQVVDALFELGKASVREIREALPQPPAYSTVRALLAKLERKGLARHEQEGARYLYSPAVPARDARSSALSRLVRVFFEGSAARAVSGLVDENASTLSDAELEEIAAAIERARRRRGDVG